MVAAAIPGTAVEQVAVEIPCVIARTTGGLYVVGLTTRNVMKMRKGRPVLLELTKMGANDDVLLFYGPSLQHLRHTISEQLGATLPPADYEAKPN